MSLFKTYLEQTKDREEEEQVFAIHMQSSKNSSRYLFSCKTKAEAKELVKKIEQLIVDKNYGFKIEPKAKWEIS